MAGDAALSSVTHIIVVSIDLVIFTRIINTCTRVDQHIILIFSLQDEVHERDGLTDFLLTKVWDMLQKMPTLKLILSSAALDVALFMKYFGNCPVIYSE